MKNGFDGQLLYGYENFNRESGRTKHNDQRKTSDNQWLDVKTNIIHAFCGVLVFGFFALEVKCMQAYFAVHNSNAS